MSNAQELTHGEGFDYVAGSPHLKHRHLRERIEQSLVETVEGVTERRGECRVLEVGAGHGPFTDVLLKAGATVTVTEMSEPSARAIRTRFQNTSDVEVVFDPTGDWVFETSETFDMVACLSVLHHIPDYERAVTRYVELIKPGGSFVSWQDPLWYSRVGRSNRLAGQVSYYSWRLTQGDVTAGVAALSKRVKGEYDDTNPRHMSEYHVVRAGVDEQALMAILEPAFSSCVLHPYWSTQIAAWQKVGDSRGWMSNFGIVASNRL